MTQKQINDGEFKKRFRNLLNDTWKYYKEGNPPRNDDKYLSMIIDEAKKEFPPILKNRVGKPWVNPERAAEWLLKWFGDSE